MSCSRFWSNSTVISRVDFLHKTRKVKGPQCTVVLPTFEAVERAVRMIEVHGKIRVTGRLATIATIPPAVRFCAAEGDAAAENFNAFAHQLLCDVFCDRACLIARLGRP